MNSKSSKHFDESVEILRSPEKLDTDQNEYRILKLQNGLKILLIHTPCIKETPNNDHEIVEKYAACALLVDVGSFSNPREIQGLAHFLEHMIFMGSEKFPVENEFQAYINQSGGIENAVTECEETLYYFNVNECNLEGALDRFSSLFVAPLLNKCCMTREREAVDCEFMSKIHNDCIRRSQLLADMGCANHPSSIFGWGNLKTLKDTVDDDTLHKTVNEFQKRHYSANRMYVAVQGNLSLDELDELAIRYFSKIPNNGLPGFDFTKFNHHNAFRNDFYERVYYMKPINNTIQLDITWCLPSYLKQYRTKPLRFISLVLSNEGPGSLYRYLQQKLWAHDVIAGNIELGFDHNSMYSLFMITISLTEAGFTNIDHVLNATFAQIRLLQNQDLSVLYREHQTIEETNYRFASEVHPTENVRQLVMNLRNYPPHDVLTGSHLFYEWDASSVEDVVNNLNSRCFNVMITKQQIPGISFNKKEKWFGTEYATIEFPEAWSCLWEKPSVNDELYLPRPNKYISTNFNILMTPSQPNIHPEKIYTTDCCVLWYKQDVKFRRPKAFMNFYFISPIPTLNVMNTTMLNLFTFILNHQIVDDLYAAQMAGLSYYVYSKKNGLMLATNGYNEKLHLIVEHVTLKMNNFLNEITPEIVETYKKLLSGKYYDMIMKPKELNKQICLQIIENIRYTTYEKYNVIDTITLNDVKEFVMKYLSQLKIIGYIHGNVSRDEANNVMKIILKNIPCDKIENPIPIHEQSSKIASGQNYVRVQSMNPNDTNTVITNFYQVGPSTIKLRALLDLLVLIMGEPLYDQIRTKEQYGYDVECTVRNNNSILGFSIAINSQETKFTASEVERRIELFRLEFLEILLNMSEFEFDRNLETLVKMHLIDDLQLSDEVWRNWMEILKEEYVFDRHTHVVKVLRSITFNEFKNFYRQFLENLNYLRKLSVQVIGSNYPSCTPIFGDDHEQTEENQDGEVVESKNVIGNQKSSKTVSLKFVETDIVDGVNNITDLLKFKMSLDVYPVTKTTCNCLKNSKPM